MLVMPQKEKVQIWVKYDNFGEVEYTNMILAKQLDKRTKENMSLIYEFDVVYWAQAIMLYKMLFGLTSSSLDKPEHYLPISLTK